MSSNVCYTHACSFTHKHPGIFSSCPCVMGGKIVVSSFFLVCKNAQKNKWNDSL